MKKRQVYAVLFAVPGLDVLHHGTGIALYCSDTERVAADGCRVRTHLHDCNPRYHDYTDRVHAFHGRQLMPSAVAGHCLASRVTLVRVGVDNRTGAQYGKRGRIHSLPIKMYPAPF